MVFEQLRRPAGNFGNISRAFAHRNYRVYVAGNSVSLIGWWLERVAVGWLAWTLTHSGTWLGLIALADFLPVLFLSPFAGVLADRRDRVDIGLGAMEIGERLRAVTRLAGVGWLIPRLCSRSPRNP